jgi:hypothetical protein
VNRYLASFVVFAWLLGRPTVARAEENPRLHYSAPPACPASEEFLAAVRERGGTVSDSSEASGAIEVSIVEAPEGYRGSVRVRRSGESSVARDVHAASCGELSAALAIVAALASQARATPEASQAQATPESVEKAEPSQPVPPAKAGDGSAEPAPRRPARLRAVGQFGDAMLPVDAGEVGVHADDVVTLSAGAQFGAIPSTVMPRFDLTISRTNFITTPDGEGHIVGGIPRVRWTVVGPAEYSVPGFSSRFLVLKAGVGGCAQFFYDLDGFVLLSCGEIAAGVAQVTTENESGAVTQDQTIGLGSAGFDLHARYNLSRLFHVGLAVGGEGWMTELRAERPDGSEIVKANWLSGYATLGVGMNF